MVVDTCIDVITPGHVPFRNGLGTMPVSLHAVSMYVLTSYPGFPQFRVQGHTGTVVSRVRAHGRLEFTGRKPGVGTYTEMDTYSIGTLQCNFLIPSKPIEFSVSCKLFKVTVNYLYNHFQIACVVIMQRTLLRLVSEVWFPWQWRSMRIWG